MEQQTKDAKIYAMYIKTKGTKNTVNDIAIKFKCSRIAAYDSINRVEQGNQTMILKALVEARNEILWKYQFQAIWTALNTENTPEFKAERVETVKRMADAGMPTGLIASKTGVARSTVMIYLK